MLSSILVTQSQKLLSLCAKSLGAISAITLSTLEELNGMTLPLVPLHLWTKSAVLITQAHRPKGVLKIQTYFTGIWWGEKNQSLFFFNWICCSSLFCTTSHNISNEAAEEAQVTTSKVGEPGAWGNPQTGTEAGSAWGVHIGNEWMARS